jgi:O-antigen/teichoic acid export membrane protein
MSILNESSLGKKLTSHLRTPLYRNGYALTLSSAVTSMAGVLYWSLAAHMYSPQIIGLNSAAISALMFLAGVSELNLMSALMRFIPGAGRNTRRFVSSAYVIALIVAMIVSLVFILRLHTWAPALGFLSSNPAIIAWFILGTMAWCIFVLQDSVLTGLRLAVWVPIENTIFALVKIGLLGVFAVSMPQLGVFASWTFALIVSLLPTNFYIFRRLIPKHMQKKDKKVEQIAAQQVIKYVAADYVGALFWLVSTTLMPVLVTALAGATANAYFFLSWTIAYSLYMVSPNMGSSLIVEASTDQGRLSSYSYRVFVQTMGLVLPAAVLLLLGAPYILRIFGSSYTQHGANLLRLLALSAIPNVVTAIGVSVARVQRRMKVVLAILGGVCILVLGLGYEFLRNYGITGVGLAWLLSQSIVAVVLLFTQLRALWAGHVWDELLKLRQVLDLWVQRLSDSLHFMFHMRPLGLLNFSSYYWRRHQSRNRVNELVPLIMQAMPAGAGAPLDETWTVQRYIHTVTDLTVVALGPRQKPAQAALKLPRSGNAVRSSQHQSEVLARLHADERLGSWRDLLPTLLIEGEVAGQTFLIERMLPGIGMQHFIADPKKRTQVLRVSVSAISELHCATASVATVDWDLYERWIGEPLQLLRNLCLGASPALSGYQNAVRHLKKELQAGLLGRSTTVSWVHGDYVPGNILFSQDGNALSGIIDWDLAQPDDLPLLDIVQLIISTRMAVQEREMGDVISGLLKGGCWNSFELALLEAGSHDLQGERLDLRTMLLYFWLRHIHANLTKSTRFRGHWLWLQRNIEAVLRCL